MFLYRAYYALVTRLAVRLFTRYPAVQAVYLRRGGGLDAILPWVSDLDFAVVVSGMGAGEREALLSAYRKFATAAVVADEFLEVLDESELPQQHEIPRRQYRLLEGKATWRLLHGRDCLADLPAMPLEKVSSGLFHEVKVWWTIFSWQLLQGRAGWDDPVQQNSVCYKVVAEILRADLALSQGVLTFRKPEALARIKPALSPAERSLVGRLESSARERFRIRRAGLVEATKDFLVTYLDRFAARLSSLPCAVSEPGVSQRLDHAVEERFPHTAERAHVGRLLESVRSCWGDACRGAYLVPSACTDLDELLLLIEVDPASVPPAGQLMSLCRLQHEAQPRLRSRIHLYLLLPHVALQIDADYLHRGWQAILCPAEHPEVFGLLAAPGTALEGGGRAGPVQGAWPPLAREFLRDRLRARREKLREPGVTGSDALGFLRLFWKVLQLELILRSAGRRRVQYPLTLAAIERAAYTEGVPLPVCLAALRKAYESALEGGSHDFTPLLPAAVAYLKEVLARPGPACAKT